VRWTGAKPYFFLVLGSEKAHTPHMTTVTRLRRLCGWSIRCASAVLVFAFCASAFADPSKNVVVPLKATQKRVVKLCYVKSIASGIPLPCERLGENPTTTGPLQIIGRGTEK
jgi:hypothetical protein